MAFHSHPSLKEMLMNGENTKETTGFWEDVKSFFRSDLVSYIVKRILAIFPSLLLISFVIFIVIQLPPGDYVSAYIAKLQGQGEQMPPEVIASSGRLPTRPGTVFTIPIITGNIPFPKANLSGR